MHTRYQDTTSKVDASAALFPIAITRRIQPAPATDFLFASGLALLCIRRTFAHRNRHPIRCLPGFYWYLHSCAKYARVCGHIQAAEDSFRRCQDDDLYGLIQIRGNDVEEFLQGQLTQDVASLDAASSLPAAWCNAKGRVITLLRLLALPDSIGLVLPTSLVDAVVQRLILYRLRSDVSIEATTEEWAGVAVSEADAFERLDAAGLLPDANAVCAGHGLITVDYSAADRFVEIFGTSAVFGQGRAEIRFGLVG